MTKKRLLVFDSGIGGLSVLKAIRSELPEASVIYLADDAGFPYGAKTDTALINRIVDLMGEAIPRFWPDCVIIACNTASTLVLPALRARFDVPFVGTVPAIKPAAEQTETGLISILATPGTVRRDYTFDLIETFAPDIRVTLVGAQDLARLAESYVMGESVPDEAFLAEIGPCFVSRDGLWTDVVVLGCTHYPLLLDLMMTCAPWPVTWIDPAPAIARRVLEVIQPLQTDAMISAPADVFLATRNQPPSESLMAVLSSFGLEFYSSEWSVS